MPYNNAIPNAHANAGEAKTMSTSRHLRQCSGWWGRETIPDCLKFFGALAAVIAFCTAFGVGFTAHLNNHYKPPANLRVTDGRAPGQVLLRWYHPSEVNYTIGWISEQELKAATAQNRNWKEVTEFKETEVRGRIGLSIDKLEPGARYAFIVGAWPRRPCRPIGPSGSTTPCQPNTRLRYRTEHRSICWGKTNHTRHRI